MKNITMTVYSDESNLFDSLTGVYAHGAVERYFAFDLLRMSKPEQDTFSKLPVGVYPVSVAGYAGVCLVYKYQRPEGYPQDWFSGLVVDATDFDAMLHANLKLAEQFNHGVVATL